ncbi:MAG: ABC transporter ATP-binding protein [Halobellus sp.]|uniref:ABC transporter ATP-binding protein n=1 Tax=Halobellus sp. TaxID=1979212 RepID=UPI0035D408A4
MTRTGDISNAGDERLDDPLLRVENVTAGYGETTVLQEVSFDVGEGEVVGLVGRNGVGKTTTLRTVTGEIRPRAGTIAYDGEAITDATPEETVKRGIALVPEERRIFGDLSVRENLELATVGVTTRDDRWRIDAVLERFENLDEKRSAAGNTLSGGEQQMLAIGRALVGNAQTLLLDEPTEGLAPYIIESVVETIESLREAGLTIVLVEQNVHLALDICDYIYVMEDGHIVHEDASGNLETKPAVLDRYLGVSLRESEEH